MYDLIWLLLPVAAASGWYIARREYQKKLSAKASSLTISGDYYKGLNYLLNDQPDKALDLFQNIIEVDQDTLEIHLALGNLFRKRGEVDRAIRIHQGVLNRPGLALEYYAETLYELACDYMSAGLLDRAENLCLELIDGDENNLQALGLLYEIYQQEKEWFRAIEIARKIEVVTNHSLVADISHFYCELAVEQWDKEPGQAQRLLDKAITTDAMCGRAYILKGDMQRSQGEFDKAIESYRLLGLRKPVLLVEALESMQYCHARLGNVDDMLAYLRSEMRNFVGIDMVLAVVRLLRTQDKERQAQAFLSEQLLEKPSLRGVHYLVQMGQADGGCADQKAVVRALDKLLVGKPLYMCGHCGFQGKVMHWCCPSCKKWGVVDPIQEFRWGESI